VLSACTGNRPPSTPTLSGPGAGRAGDTLVFEVRSRDPEFGAVTYLVDWGDTSQSVWSPFFRSGDTVQRTHVFGPGTFSVRAKARDVDRAESGWSESLGVQVSP